jgi:hypothetical protein
MPPARLSHAYATFVLRAKQFKSGRHQLEGSSIIGPASMIAWKIPNYNQWMDLLALPAVVASPARISVSVALWNGFDAARIICFTAFRCNKRLIKRSILTSSTASNFGSCRRGTPELAQEGRHRH